MTPGRHLLAVCGLLALGLALALHALLTDSATWDEPLHLTAGYAALTRGDFRLAPDHPPLARAWAALPLALGGAPPIPVDHPGWLDPDVGAVARDWLWHGQDGRRAVIFARCMFLPLLAGLALVVYAAALRLWGPSGALLAMGCCLLDPTVLAHGRLVTTDLPAALGFMLVLLTAARALELATWARFATAGLALGALAATKMSWPLVVPVISVMAVAAWRGRRAGNAAEPVAGLRAVRPLAGFGLFLAAAVVALAVLWASYGGQSRMFAGPADAPLRERLDGFWAQTAGTADAPRPGVAAAGLRLLREWPLLPEAHLFGLADTLRRTGGRTSYLFGKVFAEGPLTYFPVAFLVKTPLPLLGLAILGLWGARGGLLLSRGRTLLFGMAAFFGIYAAAAVLGRYAVGQRHLLPLYPLLHVLAGGAAAWALTNARRVLTGGLGIWLLVGTLAIQPHHLAFFNALAGGPAGGSRILADSNLDWGQDLGRLGRHQRRHGTGPLKLAYFGTADPAAYGVDFLPLPGTVGGSMRHLDGGGVYAVSVTTLLGLYDPLARDESWLDGRLGRRYRELLGRHAGRVAGDEDPPGVRGERAELGRLRWGRFLCGLRRLPPEERVGWSMRIWRLDATRVRRLLAPPAEEAG